MKQVIIVFLIFIFQVSTGFAADKNTTEEGRTWLHMTSAAGTPLWQTLALEQTAKLYLASFKKIQILDDADFDTSHCGGRISCILRAARRQNVAIVILGDANRDGLKLVSFGAQDSTQVAQIEVSLSGGETLDAFHHQLYSLVKPFIQPRGLLDAHVLPTSEIKGSGDPIILMMEKNNVPSVLLFFSAGGLWAFALLKCRRILVPGFRGIEKLDSSTLFPLLDSWLRLFLVKICLFGTAVLPFLLLAKGIGQYLKLSPYTLWILLIPFAALAGNSWFIFLTKKLPDTKKKNKLEGLLSAYGRRTRIDLNNSEELASSRRFPWATLFLLLVFTAVLLTAVEKSIQYHPKYLEQFNLMKTKVKDQLRHEQERTNGTI